MPWTTPTLRQVREMVRDDVVAAVRGSAMMGNNVLRVMSDTMGGLAHLALRYLDWAVLQALPDTAEQEWLDRHGNIWLVNADGSLGRKQATFSEGTLTLTGLPGLVVPQGSQWASADAGFESTEEIVLGSGPTEVAVRALDPGAAGNLLPGVALNPLVPLSGLDGQAVVVQLSGGADTESDADLRARVLARIRKPPMGGDADDYVAWAEAIPSVTRAWCAPNEMGIGTVTVRFMCDALRADSGGFPTAEDISTVAAYLNQKRPVAVKDFFVEAPLAEPINFTVSGLSPDTSTNRGALEDSVARMLLERARPASAEGGVLVPAQTIYAAWVSEAISRVGTIDHFDLIMADHPMPADGYIAVPGTVTYA
jgi:uncharacterized phage protein gp47/JayE